MLSEYHLTNFKAFSKEQIIPIRPITLIYGANSSGKSSIIQSLLMLKQTLEEADYGDNLLLPKGNLVDLGSYRQLIHRHEIERPFVFKTQFQIDSSQLPESVQQLLNVEFQTSITIGLETGFNYDGDSSQIQFDFVNFFLGEEDYPFITFKLTKESDYLIVDELNLNSNHIFWKNWWNQSKEELQKSFSSVLKNYFQRNDLKFHRSKKQRIDELEKLRDDLKKEYDELILVKESSEKKEDYGEDYGLDKLEDKIELIDTIINLCQTFENYKITVSLENYSEIIKYFQYIINTSFLIDDFQKFPETTSLMIEYLDDIFKNIDSYHILEEYTGFLNRLFREFTNNIVYIGPLRDYPERIYVLSNNSNKQVGKSGKMMSNILFKDAALLKSVNEHFIKFGIDYQLKCVSYSANADDELMADLYALRLVDRNDINLSLIDVGFGISQVLPVITQSLLSDKQTILIEQPELHLHPKLQTELGDLFIESALGKSKNCLIIETHSEHLMLRIMRRIRETAMGSLPQNIHPIQPEDVSVLFVESNGETSIIQEMELNTRGEFIKSWPGGFFEEELNELW